MGQSTSTHNHNHSSTSSSSAAASLSLLRPESSPHPFPFDDSPTVPRTNPGPSPRVSNPCPDYISDIPDECLALVFQFLGTGDRKRCSQVSRRWLLIEGQSRHRLSLNAQSDLLPNIPSIFARFDSVTNLALRCDRRSPSIGDEALVLISVKCRNLVRLKLRACREITDAGIADFAKNCRGLRKLSCGSCTFGAKGMNAVLDNCSSLEELSVKRLRGLTDGASAEPIGSGCAASSLKTICLKELYNGQCFGPLIIGSKNLKTLRLFRCSGDWDGLLQLISERVIGAVEVHLEKIQVGDAGLSSLSNFSNLEILHLVKTVECTNFGLVAVAERCKLLRKLHIDGCKANRIGDDGLSAVAKHCLNLQELVLIGVNPTKLSLDLLATNCQNLERLALCGSDTVGDVEISCIAGKCIALRKLCIKSCPVSNEGMKALASGCPSLVKVKVKKCRNVTCDIADWLKANRRSLSVNLDSGEQGHVDDSASDGGVPEIGFEFPPMLLSVNLGRGEQEHADASASDGGVPDIGFEFPPMFVQTAAASTSGSALSSSGLGRSSAFKSRLGILSGKNLVACTFRKWSRGGSVS